MVLLSVAKDKARGAEMKCEKEEVRKEVPFECESTKGLSAVEWTLKTEGKRKVFKNWEVI